MSTQTEDRTDLDVDLDKEIPCEAVPRGSCPDGAAWRLTIVHDGAACSTGFYCARHKKRIEAHAAIGELLGKEVICTPHRAPAAIVWSPL